MRVEAMANDRSRSKSRRILYKYASTILYEFADLLSCMNYYYFDMTLCWGFFLMGPWDKCDKQSLRNIKMLCKMYLQYSSVKVLRPTQTYHWKCLPLQLLVFSVNAKYSQNQIPGQAFLWSSLPAETKRNTYMLRQCVKNDLWPKYLSYY